MSKLSNGKYKNKRGETLDLLSYGDGNLVVDGKGFAFTHSGGCLVWREDLRRYVNSSSPMDDLEVLKGKLYPIPLTGDSTEEEQKLINIGTGLALAASAAAKDLIYAQGLDSSLIERLRIIVRQLEANNYSHNALVDKN
jgi:hypothetical protein